MLVVGKEVNQAWGVESAELRGMTMSPPQHKKRTSHPTIHTQSKNKNKKKLYTFLIRL